MNYFLLNFIIYLTLWIFFYTRIKRLSLFMVVWSGYTLSSLMSYFALAQGLYYYSLDFAEDISTPGVLFLVLLTNLAISLPIKKIDERKINLLAVNTDNLFYKYFVLINVFFFIIVSILKIYEFISIETVTSYSDIYEMLHDVDNTEQLRDMLYTNPILYTISGVGGKYCPIMAPLIMLYFFNKIAKYRELKIEYLLGMIITLIPVVLKGVVNASRGNIFFAMFEMMFFYLIIYQYIGKKVRKVILVCSISVVLFFVGISIAITESRVENRKKWNTAYEDIVIYFGQPMLNACYFQDKIKYHPMGRRFFDIREHDYKERFRDYWNLKTGSQVQLFKTYYGDVYLEFGLLYGFLLIIVYTWVWNRVILRNYYKPMYLPFLWYYFYTLIFSIFNFNNITKFAGTWFFLLIILCYYLNSKSSKFIHGSQRINNEKNGKKCFSNNSDTCV